MTKIIAHGCVFKRPLDVSVEDRLALSAQRRRLRFSFQINNVKDQNRISGPANYARRKRRAAYLVAAKTHVNPTSQKLASNIFQQIQMTKEIPWKPIGFRRMSRRVN